MSVYTALTNANKVIKQTVTSTTIGSSEDHIAVSLGPFPFHVRLKRVHLIASSTCARATVNFVTDGARYIQESYATKYLSASLDTGASFTHYVGDLSNVFHEDETRSGYICAVIRAHTGKLTSGITIKVTLEVESLISDCLGGVDATGIANLKGFRVLRVEDGGPTTDLTANLLRNGDAYGASAGQSFTCFAASTDKLYIGAPQKFDKILVKVPAYASQIAGKDITVKQWDGNSWENVTTLYNNTSDHQAAPSGLTYSGVICWTSRNDWTAKQIDTDPAKVLVDAINAGTQQPTGMASCPPRYWVEIGVSATPSPASLKLLSIQPMTTPCTSS